MNSSDKLVGTDHVVNFSRIPRFYKRWEVQDEGLEDECITFILQKSNMNKGGILKIDNTDAVIQELPLNNYSAVENSLDIEMSIRVDGTYTAFLDYDASRYSEELMRKFAQILDDMLLILQDENINLSNIV